MCVLTESVFHHLFEVTISVSVCLLLRGCIVPLIGLSEWARWGELIGLIGAIGLIIRCAKAVHIDRMRRALSVAVACSLWLDRWELGRARVGAVCGMGGGS